VLREAAKNDILAQHFQFVNTPMRSHCKSSSIGVADLPAAPAAP
jgi:hypothetical protein